jgi:hypothetical protein
MADLTAVVFVRGRKPTEEMTALVRDKRIPIVSASLAMFEASGLRYPALSGG